MTPVPDPDQAKAIHDGLSILAKIGAMVAAFVGGIVSATWVIANKVKGYDDRLIALEKKSNESIEKIDKKLDRIHVRIDEILLNGCSGDYRKVERETDQ